MAPPNCWWEVPGVPGPAAAKAVKVWLAPAATVTGEANASAAVAMLTVTVAVAVWSPDRHADDVRDPPVVPAV